MKDDKNYVYDVVLSEDEVEYLLENEEECNDFLEELMELY